MFETFDHTADLGLRVQAPDLNILFAEAAVGLFSVIVEDLQAVQPLERHEFEIAGNEKELEFLLFDWLRELLYRFDAEHLLFSRFDVKISEGVGDTKLQATAWGVHYDPQQHELGHEVKAITYHGLKLERTADGWLAEVIVDI